MFVRPIPNATLQSTWEPFSLANYKIVFIYEEEETFKQQPKEYAKCSKTFVKDKCEEDWSNAKKAEISTLDMTTDRVK